MPCRVFLERFRGPSSAQEKHGWGDATLHGTAREAFEKYASSVEFLLTVSWPEYLDAGWGVGVRAAGGNVGML